MPQQRRHLLTSPYGGISPPFIKSSFLLVGIALILTTTRVNGQSRRQFPPLFNAALRRSIRTIPSDSTCGSPTRNAYCLSSTDGTLTDAGGCIQGYCINACQGRTQLPAGTSLLIAMSPGFGTCIGSDPVNTRPGSSSGVFATVLTSNEQDPGKCFLEPTLSPRLDVDGISSFSIASWIWLDSHDLGTFVEKLTNDGRILFSLQVGEIGFRLSYGSQSVPLFASADVAIPFQQWTFIAMQVHGQSVSFFINGAGPDLSAASTVTLISSIPDADGTYRIGLSKDASSQFHGKIQDLFLYNLALSNREIEALYSGTFPPVRIQSNCRCQGTYPRIRPGQTHYCIKNGDRDDTNDFTIRISRDAHPLEYINDGDSNSMWISKFQRDVEIEVDLGDQFQIFYVVIQFYSPLPKAVIILRQREDGEEFQPWQYYADNCARFGLENNGALESPDSVNCLQFGTNGASIPYSLGNITFNLLAPGPVARPGSGDFYNTLALHDFIRARRVKVVMEDHYYVTNIRHEYYAVFEYIVTGWCDCNGHASSCNTSQLPYTCDCLESSNTEGIRCGQCKPLFNDKPYRKGDNLNDYPCIECQCYGHAESCVYDENLDPFPDDHDKGSGGVCVDCQHFTTGRFCEICLTDYYRPLGVSLYETNVCQPCDCDLAGVVDRQTDCVKVGGECPCKAFVEGRRCDTCVTGFYNLNSESTDGCQPCFCNDLGVQNGDITCNQTTGQCNCKANVRGPRCYECEYGYFGLADTNPDGCSPCNCNPIGSTTTFCDPSDGQCICKTKVQGVKCDDCKDNFFNFTAGCEPCNCNSQGTEPNTVCDKVTGQCICKGNVEGIYCDTCKEATYNFGNSEIFGCDNCLCQQGGTVNGTGSCNETSGECFCKENVQGRACSECKPNTWGLNASDPLGCQSCGCDPTGTSLDFQSVCDQNTGQCSCLSNRQGRKCDACADGFYINPDGGCLRCDCHPTGTLPGTFCDTVTGQCECKTGDFGVTGLQCNECLPTFYSFDARRGNCKPCNCLPAGSLNNTCNSVTGQCLCKELVEGLQCNTCKADSSQLDANNPFGCSTVPFQQPPPDLENRTSISITLMWKNPDHPNGVINEYRIYRNGSQISSLPSEETTFRDSPLNPYTFYSYVIEAVNAFGSTTSTPVVFQTLAGRPSDDLQLTVTDIRARSALCSWTSPSNMNGPLLHYVLTSYVQRTNKTNEEWLGMGNSVTLTMLTPYADYTLIVGACTVGGCADSEPAQFITQSAPPEEQEAPIIVALNSTALYVSWAPPLHPNGIISFYELWFRGPQNADGDHVPPASRIFHPSGRYDPLSKPEETPLSPPATSYIVAGLKAFTTYELQVLSENDAGKAASVWASGRTQEALPISVNPPSVQGVSPNGLEISWSAPTPEESQGIILVYRLHQNFKTDLSVDPFGPRYTWKQIYEGNGDTFSHTISGLTPYTEYSFILETCNMKGCINSTASTGRTLIAAPEGVQKPDVDGFNSTVMEIKWKEPLFPNGPPPRYTVEKTNIALSYPASVVRGTRFTGGGYYAFHPSVIPQNVAFTGIRFKFRLERGTGILLFTASETQEEFIAVQFVNGRPRFLFDTQGHCAAITAVDFDSYRNWTNLVNSGFHTLTVKRNLDKGYIVVDNYFQGCRFIAFVTTTNDEGLVYNDRKWHSFEARREGIYGKVTVDEEWTGQSYIRDSSCQNTGIIGSTTAVYVGGFPPDFVLRRTDRTRKVETSSLQGCIENVEILQQVYPEEIWKSLDWTQGVTNDLAFLNWQGCPINLQPGFHFMGKGFLILSNCDEKSCDVSGNRITISFRMRTALHTGFLFLMHGGTGIYIYGALVDGVLNFVISANSVMSSVTYDDPSVNFCDGKWRKINFEKVGQQASVSVTDLRTFLIGDPNIDMDLALTSDIYLGGLKAGSSAEKFMQDNGLSIPDEGFGGCIANLQINQKFYDSEITVIDVANTNMDGCPPYHEPEETCQSGLITQVYQGIDQVAYETGLLPYTDYIYRVVASNEEGDGLSSWAYGRTREGAPRGVQGPHSLRAITGDTIEVIWDEPDLTYGLLSKYVIVAYENDSVDPTFVEMEVSDVTITAVNMTGVIPNTAYMVKIRACTSGGCTESEDGMGVLTPIEAPEEVPAPTADRGATYLFVQWSPPAKPNGPITGYFLYQNRLEIYSGGKTSHNVTGLQVYTAYTFYISACTSAGCTDGPSVALSTDQLPPTSVVQPTLEVMGTSQILVTWERPDQLNGVLQSYFLMASTIEGELGSVVYNSSVLQPDYIIEGLNAGTTYYITLGACTDGGCRLGPPASATTEESAPGGVSPPVVTSPSPSQLDVKWDPPARPNGDIISYDLFQNGISVYSGLDRVFSIDGLEPYSLHVFYVSVCTAEGCARSEEIRTRTMQAQPEGILILEASVADSRTVNVSWSLPAKPNGDMIFQVYFYGLFYVDVDNWNFTTVQERRKVLEEKSPYTVYQVSPLIPYSNYSIHVNASNLVGYILSNLVTVTMPPGSPDGMAPPVLVSDTTTVKVTWRPVGRVNVDEVPAYRLQFRETTENAIIQDVYGPTVTLNYTKKSLDPYTEYQFRVTVTNSYGFTESPWALVVTKQDRPASMNIPLIVGVKARYVDVAWSIPIAPNGIISHFNIFQNNNLHEQVAGNQTSYRIDGLQPYTDYFFTIEACTVAGCTMSSPSSTIRTLEDIAEQLSEPQLTAMSPTAVQIEWSQPGKPHGIITSYILQRKVNPNGNISILATLPPNANRVYLDESNELSPFTSYSYRVNVQNDAGIAFGPWAQATTGASRPAGVRPPTVTSITPTSVEIQWEMPVQVNGVLEEYILRFPDPQVVIRNTSQYQTVVDDLTAYTQYSITLTACTSGGCTESAATVFTTNPSLPSGQAPPNPVAISQSIISISWQPPTFPNGPNIQFELLRMKVRQPLDASVTDIGQLASLYIGTDTFYEDRALPMFTTFVYRITTFNDIGQITSENSSEATTFGGLPRLPPTVFAEAPDHQSIEVNWTLPNSVQLQGEVEKLTLEATKTDQNVTVFPDISTSTFVIGSLHPNSVYFVKLIVTIFGGASISNDPIAVRTKDGAPEGLDPPVLTVISTRSLRVSWSAPSKPNGEITSYRIIMDGTIIDTGSALPGSRVLDDLEPYTIYEIEMEACTVYACVRSMSAFGTTAEASPLDLEAPVVKIENSTMATVSWTPPSKPNGIIIRYDLWRKTQRSCNDMPISTRSPEVEKCTYIECSILENLCGTSCYSGNKVCCDGVIHEAKADFACCGQEYIFKASPDMVCCTGKFFTPALNHQCCGKRYIEVLPNQICCPDESEDRVSVSEGDECCGSIPFYSNSAQMCCEGILMSSFGRQCCGGLVTSDTTVCCGDNQNGQVYLPRAGYACCGQSYVEEALTLCCVSDTGHAQTHSYESDEEKSLSAHTCCGINVITTGLSCCNFVGYDPLTQVCADKSSQQTGCGVGTVCSLNLASFAQCDRCDFDATRQTCGFALGNTESSASEIQNQGENGTICTTETERIYSGLDLIYQDTGLTPYSQYEFYIVAVNTAGTVTSEVTSVRTVEAVPGGVLPPTTKVAPGELFAIYISWTIPEEPNGVITGFSLERDGIEIYTGINQTFTDNFNILPYQSYTYTITACNIAGCTQSSPTVVATAQALPEEVLPPIAEAMSSTEIKFRGQPPGKPNGVILVYSITLLQLDQVFNSSVPEEFIVEGLLPYTVYTLEMIVCTVVGCVKSPQVNVTTEESLPEGVHAPRVTVISSSIIELYWRHPDAANGQLSEFIILQTNPVPVTQVYVGFDTNVRLESLVPGQSYSYQLQVSNGVGSVQSRPIEIVMPLAAPLNVPPPQNVRILSSTSIQVQWISLTVSEGEIDQYRVLLNMGQETEVQRGVGLDTQVTISDLLPYTEYEIRLQACLRNVLNGCGTSSAVIAVTKEDIPSGLDAPDLSAISFDTIQVRWQPPKNPNGEITQYRVYQRNVGSTTEILINQIPGDVLEFTHSGQDLQPFTEYEYKVVAQNSAGENESDWSSVRTKEARPEGLMNPVVESTSSYGITLSWSPPEKPNGRLLQYKIFYKKLLSNSQTAEEFITVHGNLTSASISALDAFSSYSVTLEVANSAGSLKSGSVTASTQEGFPEGLPDFDVEKITSGTSVILKWDEPSKPNGIITMYRLYESGFDVAVYMGLRREFEYTRLNPFTMYSITLEACTSAGCTMGIPQTFTTAEVSPSSQPSPTVGTVNSSYVTLQWTPPINPNGVILMYEVLRRSSPLRKRRSVDLFADLYISSKSAPFDDINEFNASQNLIFLNEQCRKGSMNKICSKIYNEFLTESATLDQDFSNVYRVHEISMNNPYYPNLHRVKRQAEDYEIVYRTTDTGKDSYTYTDSGLQPFTQYQYSIRTTNARGHTDSPWQTVTTDQAPPEGVQPPILTHIPDSIHSIKIRWSLPGQLNGILQSYQIQRNDSVPNSFSADEEREFIDTQLSAFTVYSYTLTACTGGGCTKSESAVIQTTEAPPLQVRAPLLQSSDPNSIEATWSPPEISNGEIIQYRLKMDGEFVFSGLQLSHVIDGLVPYSKHRFTLTACTNGGCTESGEVTARPLDAPPTDMPAPVLRVLSSSSIEINWSPPLNPNGIISSYDVRRDGRLIYTSSIAVIGTLPLSYTDYSLVPGESYTYTIIARNRKGSVESGSSSARTYSSSPTGLAAPFLTAISSTTIKVDWSAPSRPNGLIANYSLYLGSDIVYTGPRSQLAYTIPGLEFYTEYKIRVEACTDRGCVVSATATERTLEAPPQDQPDPSLLALGNEMGRHSGVRAAWEPPRKLNGILLSYELYRREVIFSADATTYGEPQLVYNGSMTMYVDEDPNLQPHSDYQYMIMAVNKAGQAASTWTLIQTKEGMPVDIPAPVVLNVTSTTVTVEVKPPGTPHGRIQLYKVLVNDTVHSSSRSLQQIVGESSPLLPFTTYSLKAQACTAVACGESPGTVTQTDSAKPHGLEPIQVKGTTNESVELSWDIPTSPNGRISRYEVYIRQACPHTFQPFEQPCNVGDVSTIYSGIDWSIKAEGLNSYTAYEFQVQAFNDKGGVDFPQWMRATTNQSDPLYIQFPNLLNNGSISSVSWESSFRLNGRLREYMVLANGVVVYRGFDTKHGVQRKTDSEIITFIIQLITDKGQATTPAIIFDPNAIDNIGTTSPPPLPTVAAAASTQEVYEEVWFIIVMCIIALILLFVIITVCLCKNGRKAPYIRERMPLPRQAHQKPMRNLYVIDSGDGSVLDATELPRERLSDSDNFFQGPGYGLINPAFAQDGPLSQASSSKLSRSYTQREIDDTMRDWDRLFDSGLFDDLDDDVDDDESSFSGPTYSYTKEQTVFTDTHL